MKPNDKIEVVRFYTYAVNEIIQPESYVAATRYFISRWMPDLGAEGTRIVLALRSMGFYNPKTGERREGIPITIAELAKMCGCSVATIKREFGPAPVPAGQKIDPDVKKNPILHLFVSKQQSYRKCPVTGNILHSENVYTVRMDDPIHPDDEERLSEIIARKFPDSHEAQNEPHGKSCEAQIEPHLAQNEPDEVQNEPRVAQSDSKTNQNEPTLIITSAPVLTDASLFTSGVSASLSPEKPREWSDLTSDEQRPWLDSAESHPTTVEAKITTYPDVWEKVKRGIVIPIAKRMYRENRKI